MEPMEGGGEGVRSGGGHRVAWGVGVVIRWSRWRVVIRWSRWRVGVLGVDNSFKFVQFRSQNTFLQVRPQLRTVVELGLYSGYPQLMSWKYSTIFRTWLITLETTSILWRINYLVINMKRQIPYLKSY